MKNVVCVILYMVTMVNCECSIKGAELCRRDLMTARSDGGTDIPKLCNAYINILACLTAVQCNDVAIYETVKTEATKNMNVLCDNGGSMMAASISILLFPLLTLVLE